jgi:hypothetical protein
LSEKLFLALGPQLCLRNVMERLDLAQALLQPPFVIDAEEDAARPPPLVWQAEDALEARAWP